MTATAWTENSAGPPPLSRLHGVRHQPLTAELQDGDVVALLASDGQSYIAAPINNPGTSRTVRPSRFQNEDDFELLVSAAQEAVCLTEAPAQLIVMRKGQWLGFRSAYANNKILQLRKDGEHHLYFYRADVFDKWEHWKVHGNIPTTYWKPARVRLVSRRGRNLAFTADLVRLPAAAAGLPTILDSFTKLIKEGSVATEELGKTWEERVSEIRNLRRQFQTEMNATLANAMLLRQRDAMAGNVLRSWANATWSNQEAREMLRQVTKTHEHRILSNAFSIWRRRTSQPLQDPQPPPDPPLPAGDSDGKALDCADAMGAIDLSHTSVRELVYLLYNSGINTAGVLAARRALINAQQEAVCRFVENPTVQGLRGDAFAPLDLQSLEALEVDSLSVDEFLRATHYLGVYGIAATEAVAELNRILTERADSSPPESPSFQSVCAAGFGTSFESSPDTQPSPIVRKSNPDDPCSKRQLRLSALEAAKRGGSVPNTSSGTRMLGATPGAASEVVTGSGGGSGRFPAASPAVASARRSFVEAFMDSFYRELEDRGVTPERMRAAESDLARLVHREKQECHMVEAMSVSQFVLALQAKELSTTSIDAGQREISRLLSTTPAREGVLAPDVVAADEDMASLTSVSSSEANSSCSTVDFSRMSVARFVAILEANNIDTQGIKAVEAAYLAAVQRKWSPAAVP